jgi:glycerol-3-phosphate O-acyltransferase / dihydroxyacetone phosphate acyltransferase
MNKYNEIYKVNSQKAMLALRDDLAEEIKKLIIHIPSTEYYKLYEFLRDFYNHQMLNKLSMKKSLYNSFIASQKIISCLDNFEKNEPEQFKQLDIQTNKYSEILNSINTRNWVVEIDASLAWIIVKTIGLFVLSPFFVYGLINNLLPYYLPNSIRKKIKDPQFLSSVNFVIGIVIFPLFYLLQFVLVWIFADCRWLKYLYLLSLPISGLLAFNIHRSFVKLKSQWRFFLFKKSEKFKFLINLGNEIKQAMDKVTEKYL